MEAGVLYKEMRAKLAAAGIEDAGFEADALLRHVAGGGRFDAGELSDEQAEQARRLADKRAEHYPLQYILDSWPFMRLELAVGPGVLIPRPETEEVCEAAIALLKGVDAPVVLDLCAGSGAIALGIQDAMPDTDVTAVELYDAAFEYLQRNCEEFAKEHNKRPRVVQADVEVYYRQIAPESVDMIVANPPYVTQAEYEKLAPELAHEPRQALVPPGGEDDGLLFYRLIAREYHTCLKAGGWLVFEIGAWQGDDVRDILAGNGYNKVEIRRDMAGQDRIALGQR